MQYYLPPCCMKATHPCNGSERTKNACPKRITLYILHCSFNCYKHNTCFVSSEHPSLEFVPFSRKFIQKTKDSRTMGAYGCVHSKKAFGQNAGSMHFNDNTNYNKIYVIVLIDSMCFHDTVV